MNKSQILVLIGLCLCAAGAWWLVNSGDGAKKKTSSDTVGAKLLPNFPINEIRKIRITKKQTVAEIAKVNGIWTVPAISQYPADYSKIGNLLKKVNELKIAQVVRLGKKDYARLELQDPKQEKGGTRVEFFNEKGKKVAAILLGKEHKKAPPTGGRAMPWMSGGWPDGRYVLVEGKKIVALVAETFSAVSAKKNDWLNKSFFKLDKLKSGKALKGKTLLWQVSRKKESDSLSLEGKLAAGETVDNSKLSAVDSALRYPSFNNIAGPRTPKNEKANGLDSGRRFEAESMNGLVYTLGIGKEKDGNYPLTLDISYRKPPMPKGKKDESKQDRKKREAAFQKKVAEFRKKAEDEQQRYGKWIYLVSANTVENLLLERKQLIKKPKVKKTAGSKVKKKAVAPGKSVKVPQPPPPPTQ